MCMFSSTCLKGIVHITAFYVWLNVHTKGCEWRPWPSGATDNTGCLHRWSKTQRQAKKLKRRGDQTAQWFPAASLHSCSHIGEKAWTVARCHSGQRARRTSTGNIPRLSRCKYLDLSFRLSPFQPCASQEKRSFKSSHQRNRSYSHFTALHQLNEVSKKDVSVPLAETLSVIGHLRQRRPETKKASYQSATETAGELMMKSEWK